MLKIAVITCYKDPDYVRARTLRAALKACPGVETIVIKNQRPGLGRYAEVFGKVTGTKFHDKPDAYLLTFRGYELLPFILFLAGTKPVIFDEFINLTEWVVDEHHKLRAEGVAAKLLNWWYSRQLRRCRLILADTQAHADYSAKRSNVPIEKYLALPVGTDETVFTLNKYQTNTKHFQVFYYGSTLPLHGLGVMLAAAEKLKNQSGIEFLLVGGGQKAAEAVARAKTSGANVSYQSWIPFDQLPATIAASQLCLAGPFGNTVQSQLVIRGTAYQFLACGAPTVIGANVASTDFVDKTNALVVPQGDANALAETIDWAYKNQIKLPEIGRNGRQLFEEKFSTDAIARQLQPRLDRLLADERRELVK